MTPGKKCRYVQVYMMLTGERQRADFAAFQYLKGAYKQEGSQLFTRGDNSRTRGNGSKLKEGRLRLDVRGKLLTESGEVLEQLPREAVDAPSIPGGVQGQVGWAAWAGFKRGGWWPCLCWGGWSFMILGVPSNPHHSMAL